MRLFNTPITDHPNSVATDIQPPYLSLLFNNIQSQHHSFAARVDFHFSGLPKPGKILNSWLYILIQGIYKLQTRQYKRCNIQILGQQSGLQIHYMSRTLGKCSFLLMPSKGVYVHVPSETWTRNTTQNVVK